VGFLVKAANVLVKAANVLVMDLRPWLQQLFPLL